MTRIDREKRVADAGWKEILRKEVIKRTLKSLRRERSQNLVELSAIIALQEVGEIFFTIKKGQLGRVFISPFYYNENARKAILWEIFQVYSDLIEWQRVWSTSIEYRPEWRNRQTRTTQNRVRAISCGFDSHLGHKVTPENFFQDPDLIAEPVDIEAKLRSAIHYLGQDFLYDLKIFQKRRKLVFLSDALDKYMPLEGFAWSFEKQQYVRV